MRSRFLATLISGLALRVLAAPASGTAPATPSDVREHVAVSLVEVPVTVLDSGSKPVRGLQASDFQLFDNGVEVKIESLDVNEFHAPGEPPEASPAASKVNPAARRRFFLVFDLSFITPAELERSREAARRFLRENLGPSDLAAIAVLSTKTVAELLHDFSADRASLSKAIDSLHGRNQFFRPNVAMTAEADAGGRGQYTPREIAMMQREGRDEDVRQTDNLVKGLGAIGTALAPIPGRKQIVLFSRGFDAASDPLMLAKVGDAMAELRRDDCIVYAIDVSGVRSMSDRSRGSASGAAENEVLADIAQETGGEFLTNSNDVLEELGRVLDATSVVYVLSFHPTLTGKPGERHRLEVRTSRPGVRLYARPAYEEPRTL